MNELEFWLKEWDNAVIKVWSNILTWKWETDWWIDVNNVKNIVSWIDYLMNLWINVFLVSSWAVSIWRRNFEKAWVVFEWDLTDDQKAMLSSNGQISLIALYEKLFREKQILIGQNLLTHNNFRNQNTLSELKKVWKISSNYKLLPIINENDPISREELKFWDNDELAGLVAKEVNAKVLLLLSTNWFYKWFWTENKELITEVNHINELSQYSIDGVSEWWKWWMPSKLKVFTEMYNKDILWILTNWWQEDVIQKIFSWEEVERTVFNVAK